jgi:hypothetical protein
MNGDDGGYGDSSNSRMELKLEQCNSFALNHQE